MHSAKIILDSVSVSGARLTTMEVVMPRIVLAEFNTHRVFSRNSASSRAIPIERMIRMVEENPYIPSSWGKNQRGMQADEEVSQKEADVALATWLRARDYAVKYAQGLLEIGIHKQITNRLLEPFMWHTVIVTATEWSNFFHLRNNSAAHPDIMLCARLMQELYENTVPQRLNRGTWHMPYIQDEEYPEYNIDVLKKISVARCARVSYLTHDGQRDIALDLSLHDKLLSGGHMSPFEHVATPAYAGDVVSGNFRGWRQYRKMIPHESDILALATY